MAELLVRTLFWFLVVPPWCMVMPDVYRSLHHGCVSSTVKQQRDVGYDLKKS